VGLEKVGWGLENLSGRVSGIGSKKTGYLLTHPITGLYIRSKAGISSAFPFVSKMSKRPLEYPDTKKDRI